MSSVVVRIPSCQSDCSQLAAASQHPCHVSRNAMRTAEQQQTAVQRRANTSLGLLTRTGHPTNEAPPPQKQAPRKPLLGSYERELLFKFWRSRFASTRPTQTTQPVAAATRKATANGEKSSASAAVQTRAPVRVVRIAAEGKTVEVPITQRAAEQPSEMTVSGQKAKLFEPYLLMKAREQEHPRTCRPFTAPADLLLPLDTVDRPCRTAQSRPKTSMSACLKGVADATARNESGASEKVDDPRRIRSAMNMYPSKSPAAADQPAAAAAAASGPVTIEMPKDYDEARKTFGWRFEVPNDPLGVKQQYLAKRLSYALSYPDPPVLPLEPKLQATNRNTFFYSTFPKAHMSYTIAPDLSSEDFNRQRDDLRKKGSWNYRYRDFSFMY